MSPCKMAHSGTKAIFANLVGPELPDLIAGLVSLLSLIAFVQFWKPPYRKEFECNYHAVKPNQDVEKVGAEQKEQETYGPSSSDSADAVSVHRDEKTEVDKASNHSSPRGSSPTHENADREDIATTDPTAIVPTTDITKPTLMETVIAWSPWVLIVVVVIM